MTHNYQRRLSKKQSEYPDDCGTWDSKKNVTTTKEYIYSNQLLSSVDKKNGLLGRETVQSVFAFEHFGRPYRQT
jgi:hypothetical protein